MAKSSLLLTLTLIICSALSIKATSPPDTCTATATANNEPESNNLVVERREVYGGGRIFNISHQYTANMPSWASTEGLGQFLWLTKSMKNGSEANFPEMKMPTHTGTHVDAPGHVFDHYFDAGFDVDTLDLEALNDVKNKWENNSWGRKLIVQKKRASLNDFDRFKIMLAKIKRGATIKQELAKLKEAA